MAKSLGAVRARTWSVGADKGKLWAVALPADGYWGFRLRATTRNQAGPPALVLAGGAADSNFPIRKEVFREWRTRGGALAVERVQVVTMAGSPGLTFPAHAERALCRPAGQCEVIEFAQGSVLGTRTVRMEVGEPSPHERGAHRRLTSGLPIPLEAGPLVPYWIRVSIEQEEVFSGSMTTQGEAIVSSWALKCAPGHDTVEIRANLDLVAQRAVSLRDGKETELDDVPLM